MGRGEAIKGIYGDLDSFEALVSSNASGFVSEKSAWQTAREAWIEQQAARYLRTKKEEPLFVSRCHNLASLMSGSIGLTPDEAALLAAFEQHAKDGLYAPPLDGYVSKKDGSPLAKHASKLETLQSKRDNPQLPNGVVSLLNEWLYYHVTGCAKPKLIDRKVCKGLECEDTSIALYNEVFGTDFRKNEIRITDKWMTGCCDILDAPERKIVDIKTVWDVASFEAKKSAALDPLHEWQGDGYMHLYNCDSYEVAYCLVDTPEHLLLDAEKWDECGNPTFYGTYSHIPPEDRIYIVRISRNESRIQAAKERIELCQAKVIEMWRDRLNGGDFKTMF